jgi:transglutaminase-like putative cysteine protease
MILNIDVTLDYELAAPTDVLLMIEAARGFAGQRVLEDTLTVTPNVDAPDGAGRRIPGPTGLGTRLWFRAEERFAATYRAKVEVTRPDPDLPSFATTAPHELPGETTDCLMPSRYCPSDQFEPFVAGQFAGLAGGALAQAISDWLHENLTYTPGSSGPSTTAVDTFLTRQGICRDYAHVLIAMARAGGIPARMAAVYAPGVEPPDFHAVAELWLGDQWHLVDATGMASPSDIAVIGVGKDAAEIAFLTSYGAMTLQEQSVKVARG